MTHQGEVPSVNFWSLSDKKDTSKFCCGEKAVNDFFRKDAWKFHKRTSHRVTCTSVANSDGVAGFYSLASVTEEIRKLPGNYARLGQSGEFPCLQLAWMGVQRPLQKSNIGIAMLGKIVSTFAKVGEQIGLPHLIVFPINEDVKRFYKKMDFEEYDGGTKMFLSLQIARDAVRE
ncbi:hypothetical protein [Sphingobium aromaticiconvertens]|uniref:hypothetical protein n=1 Tax=Sphingobium aromaticiconvertens TaxID=365341 RepID=UPI0030193099